MEAKARGGRERGRRVAREGRGQRRLLRARESWPRDGRSRSPARIDQPQSLGGGAGGHARDHGAEWGRDVQQRRAHQGGRLLLDRDAVARGESESVTALHPERYCSVRGLAPRGRVSVAAGAEEDNNNMAGSGCVLVERLEVIGGVIGMLTKREGLIFNLKFC